MASALRLGVGLLAGILLGVGAVGASGGTISVAAVEFVSPMTILHPLELDLVRARLEAGEEPQATAFRRMLAEAEAALGFASAPPDTLHVMGGYQRHSNLNQVRALMEAEANAAYVTALAWLYTGDRRFAEKSASILRGWTEADTRFTGMDRGLQLGSWFNRMLYAADILKAYPEWNDAGAAEFEAWWRRAILPDVRRVALLTENNWKEAGVLGVLTAAVVFEDRHLLALGLTELDSYFHPRRQPVRPRRPARFSRFGPPPALNWKFANDELGTYFPREVTRVGGLRGVTYTAYTLTSLVPALEIARYAGFDWWERRAANGATMVGAIENYFRWNELGEPFPWHPSPNRHLARKNPFEIAHNHFPGKVAGLEEWLRANRPVDGRQGDPYVTLNRGDIWTR